MRPSQFFPCFSFRFLDLLFRLVLEHSRAEVLKAAAEAISVTSPPTLRRLQRVLRDPGCGKPGRMQRAPGSRWIPLPSPPFDRQGIASLPGAVQSLRPRSPEQRARGGLVRPELLLLLRNGHRKRGSLLAWKAVSLHVPNAAAIDSENVESFMSRLPLISRPAPSVARCRSEKRDLWRRAPAQTGSRFGSSRHH